jgi:pSer/pThr/pTyr-binding forkhead associated (FHA) protein
MLPCAKCGFENPEDANFCARCGSRRVPQELSETTQTYIPGSTDDPRSVTSGSDARGGGPCLLIRAGGGREGEEIGLDTELLTIGRHPESHLFLDDVTVSRHHARIVRDATGLVAEDLNSLNGTYVNRRRVERHHLSDGDELQIGKFKLAYLEPLDF